MTTFSEEYTRIDHAARDADRYAETKFRLLIEQVPAAEPLRILNVGCGTGQANEWLADRGHVVHALDPDPGVIATCTERLRSRSDVADRILLTHTTLEDFSTPEGYDAVFALDVLEHIADDRAAFAKIHSLLKPGGSFFAAVPAMPSLFGHHDRMLGHYRRYTAAQLRQKVSPLFDIGYLRYFGLSLVPVALVYSRVLKRPYPIQQSNDVSVVRRVLKGLLAIERVISPPTGTSLLMVGRALRVADATRLS